MMKDKAEYARKGIARGRSIVVLEYQDGILLVAENPSTLLHKISEIYDRIAFAGVGKYNEFENLRIAGIRHADVKGYSYSRGDVTAKALANAYSQALGNIFTQDIKPFEVEVLVAEVAHGNGTRSEMYHVLYDGTIEDERNFAAMGGQAEDIRRFLRDNYRENVPLAEAFQLGVRALTVTQNVASEGPEVAVPTHPERGPSAASAPSNSVNRWAPCTSEMGGLEQAPHAPRARRAPAMPGRSSTLRQTPR
jgi:proteasome alpha subunit